MLCTRPAPTLSLYTGGFPLNFIKIHREVFDLKVSGELTGVPDVLYQWLAFHADAGTRYRAATGVVKELSVSKTASVLGCHRYTLNRAVQVLTDLGLFEPNPEGANCLAGILPLLAAPAPVPDRSESAPKSAPAPRVSKETEKRLRKEALRAHERQKLVRQEAEEAEQRAQQNGTGSKSRIADLRQSSGV